jgi:hypothetical protein
MADRYKHKLHTIISDNVIKNVEVINNLLSSDPKEIKIVEKSEELLELLKINTEELIRNESKYDYYDLDKIDELSSMMEIDQLNFDKDSKKRQKLAFDKGSTSSLSSSTISNVTSNSSSIEETISISNEDVLKEIQTSIEAMKENLGKISNVKLEKDNFKNIIERPNSKSFRFGCYVVGPMKKVLDDLSEVARSDNLENDQKFYINDEIVDELKLLNKVMIMTILILEI